LTSKTDSDFYSGTITYNQIYNQPRYLYRNLECRVDIGLQAKLKNICLKINAANPLTEGHAAFCIVFNNLY
jgi:hypothetical protein